MKKFISLFFTSFLLFSFQIFAQEIVEGTYSYRGTGTYYPMVSFDTSPYEDFYYIRNQGRNNGDIMNFRLLKPNNYNPEDTQKKYPMILMMHGQGESGNYGFSETDPQYLNNDKNLLWGGAEHLAAVNRDPSDPKAFPGFVFFPQNAEGEWSPFLGAVEQTIELLLDEYNIDPNRIYIHGLSAGATGGVWRMVKRRPDLFAAFLPMSGVPSNPLTYSYSTVIHIPLWLFQGEIDATPISTLHKADITIREITAAGATPRYTVYEGVGHATWNRAYNEDDFFSWMLGYSKLSIFAYNGKTEFCEGDPINARLGISPGEGYNYEWSKDDVPIPNSNTNEITATEYGYYKVRFERPIRGWTEWSDSVVIGIQAPTTPVGIIADGTTVFPSPDNKESVTLSAPEGYVNYEWSSGQTSQSITVNNNQVGSYRVKVTEADGCPSAFSLPIVVVNNGDNITAPANLTANTVSETEINLFWTDNSSTEKGFEVYRSTTAGGPYTFVALTDPNEIFYADKGLASNTTYYYVIRAVSSIGGSQTTPEVNATTSGDVEKPSTPQNLTAFGNMDLTSITLTWDASQDNISVTGYDIYRINTDNSLTFIGNTDENTFIVPGLTENSNYTFIVKAKDQNGNTSLPSNQATTSVTFCGLNFNLYKDGTWHNISELRPQEIHAMGNVGNFNIGLINQYYPNDKNYFAFDFEGYIYITNSGQYTFTTRSDDGSMLWIDDLNGEPLVNNDGRHGPQDRSGTRTLTQGRHKIKVTFFEANSGEILEVSYKGPDTGGNTVPIPSEVLCSNPNISTPTTPAVPSNLVANATSESTINLSWTDNSSNETGFELYRKKTDGQYALVHSADAGATTFEDTGLEANTTYFYKLRAIGNTGESAFTDESGKLTYSLYEGSWTVLPDFNNLTPVRSGDINNFDISSRANTNNFAFKFDGKIFIETAGDYTFYTSSDDGSQLFIDGSLVVENDGLHGTKEINGTVDDLPAGMHDIRVTFFEAGGGETLIVQYKGPGISKQTIPDEVLNTGIVKATTLGDTEAPEAPGDLLIKSIGTTSVGLSWLPSTDNVGVTEYHIYDRVADTLLAKTGPRGHIINNENTTENEGYDALNFFLTNNDAKKERNGSTHRILAEEAEPLRISTLVRGLPSGQNYTVAVKAVDASDNSSTFSSAATFKTNSEQPLPIELMDFYALPEEGYVEINWVTASELNNDYFTIERSLDGKEFRPIAKVDGKGDSNKLQYYNHQDNAPVNGVMYYQLKQTDTNGVYKYSNIIRISYNKGFGQFAFQVFPNPVNSPDFTIALTSSNKESKVRISIIDMLGKEHYQALVFPEALLNKMDISKEKLSAGIYIITLQQADNIAQKKIIVE